jgi:hypothetical protein
MKAMTSARSWALSMMFGMERCADSSAALSAIADMPLTLAMAPKVGARFIVDAVAVPADSERELPASGRVSDFLRKYRRVQ